MIYFIRINLKESGHKMNSTIKASLALSAAALFVAGCSKGGESAPASGAETASGDVKCMGVNECKGTGACGVPGGHSCAGQNECKGKGWIKLGAADCDSKGGTPQGS